MNTVSKRIAISFAVLALPFIFLSQVFAAVTLGTTTSSNLTDVSVELETTVNDLEPDYEVSDYGYFVNESDTRFSYAPEADYYNNMEIGLDGYLSFWSRHQSSAFTKYSYWKFLNGDGAVVNTGDVFLYSVKLATNAGNWGGIDLRFSDGGYARDLGWTDQNGISCHPSNNIRDYAYDKWYDRKCTITAGMDGKTISWIDAVNQNNSDAAYLEYFDNVVLQDSSGNIKKVFYTSGAPDYNNTIDFGNKVGSSATALVKESKAVDTNGKVGKSVLFDGSTTGSVTETLHSPNTLDMSGGYTYNVWVKPTETLGSAQTIIDTSMSPVELNYNIILYRGASSNSLFYKVIESASTIRDIEITDVFTNDTWTNIGLSYDSDGSLDVYVNGSSVHSSTISTPSDTMYDVVTMGSGFKGYIDELRIYTSALSSDDMLALYNSGNGYITKQMSMGGGEMNFESFEGIVSGLEADTTYYIAPYIYTDSLIVGDAVSITTETAADVTVGTTTGDDTPSGSNELITNIVYDEWVDIDTYGYLLSPTTSDFITLLKDHVYISMDDYAGPSLEYLDFTSDNVSPSTYSAWGAMNIDNVLIQEGDILEYDVYTYEDRAGRGNVRIMLSDGSTAGAVDQYGLSCTGGGVDTSDYNYLQWDRRECSIDGSHTGKFINKLAFTNSDPGQAYMHVLYKDIVIKDKYGNIKDVVYGEGDSDYYQSMISQGHVSDWGKIIRKSIYTTPNTTETDSVKGDSFRFDNGDNSYRVNISDLDITNAYSISFWILPMDTNGTETLFDIGNDYFLNYNPALNVLSLNTSSGISIDTPISFDGSTWKNIVVTHDQSGNVKLYIDSVLAIDSDLEYSISSSPEYITMGGPTSATNSGGFYDGFMDELFVFDSVLSQDEIDMLYTNKDKVSADTETFYVSEDLSGSSFVNSVTGLKSDTDYLVRPFVQYGNDNIQFGNSFSFTTLSSGSMAFGDVANDPVSSNHVTLESNVTFDDWVVVEKYGYFLEKTTDDFNVIRNAGTRLSMDVAVGESGEYLDFRSDNKWTGDSVWKAFDLANIEINAGDVLEYDTYFYDDHEGQGSILIHYSDNSFANAIDQNGIACDGESDLSDYGYRNWYSRECTVAAEDEGKIADLLVFKNGKTDANIHVLYDNIVLKDSEGNVKATIYTDGAADYTSTYYAVTHVSDTGSITTMQSDHVPTVDGVYSVQGGSYLFNGTNDFVEQGLGGLDLNDGYSISVWLSTTETTSTDTIMRINDDVYLLNDLASNLIHLKKDGYNNAYASGVTYPADTWRHLVITQDVDGKVTMFVDGVENSTANLDYINIDSIVLGVGTDQGGFYTGHMDEFSVFEYVLSDEEIQTLYNSNADVVSDFETVYLSGEFEGPESFNTQILNLDANTEYSAKPFIFYGNNKFAVGEYTSFTTGGINQTPETGHDQISYSSNFFAGKEQTIQVTYTDINGGEDLDKLYLKLQNPDGDDIEYYVANTGVSVSNGTPTAVTGDEYIETIKYSLQSNGNDLVVTWKPTLEWDWTESSDIKIGIKATDKGGLSTDYSYTTTEYTYEKDLVFYGTLTLTGSQSGLITTGESVYNNESVTWSGLKVVYQGTSNVYPNDDDFDVLLVDGNGRTWLDEESSGENFSIVETFVGNDAALSHSLYLVNTPTGVSLENEVERDLRVVTYVAYNTTGEDEEESEEEEEDVTEQDSFIQQILDAIEEAEEIELEEETEIVDVDDLDDEDQIVIEVGGNGKGKDKEKKLKVTKDNKVHVHENEEILISAPVEATGELGETEVVVAEFNDEIYVLELNEEGTHYEATISTAGVQGTKGVNIYVYDIESKLANQAYTMSLQIDPYGYVYEMRFGQQVRIENAEITLYVKEDDDWVVYESEGITNPQTTDIEGEYSFYVEPGTYMIKVAAKGYKDFESEEIVVEEHIIEYNIEMERNLMFMYISGGVFLVLLLVLGIVLTLRNKKEATR